MNASRVLAALTLQQVFASEPFAVVGAKVAQVEREAVRLAEVLEEAESVEAAETDSETIPAIEAEVENLADADASEAEKEQAAKEDGA